MFQPLHWIHPCLGVLVLGTGMLSHSTWRAGTEAKAPVSLCDPRWGELGRAEPSAQDSLLCPHVNSAHGGFSPWTSAYMPNSV